MYDVLRFFSSILFNSFFWLPASAWLWHDDGSLVIRSVHNPNWFRQPKLKITDYHFMIVLRTRNFDLKMISNAKLRFLLNIGSLVTIQNWIKWHESPDFNDVMHNSLINNLGFKTKLKIKHGPCYTPSSNFKFSDRTFYILWNKQQCVVRIEAVVFTYLIKVTRRNLPLLVNK